MKIKHLLLIIIFILISISFIPIYEYGYEIGTFRPTKLDDVFSKISIFFFIFYHILLLFPIIIGIVYLSCETNFFKKIGKFLNKKIL